MGLFTFSDSEHQRKSNITIAIAVCKWSLNQIEFYLCYTCSTQNSTLLHVKHTEFFNCIESYCNEMLFVNYIEFYFCFIQNTENYSNISNFNHKRWSLGLWTPGHSIITNDSFHCLLISLDTTGIKLLTALCSWKVIHPSSDLILGSYSQCTGWPWATRSSWH